MGILARCNICRKRQSLKNKKCSCGQDLDKAKRANRICYWISYRLPDGRQRRESVGHSIEKARAAEGKRRAQKKEGRVLEMLPESKSTFNQLSEWYLDLEKVKALASYWLVKLSLKKFNSVFGHQMVNSIKLADLENYQAKRLKEGRAPGTIDHEIGKAKTMIIKAFDNGKVSGETLRTFKRCKKLLKPGSDVRDRILSVGEFESLMRCAQAHLKPIIATGYYSGMRRGEIMQLTWDMVSLDQRLFKLPAKITKDEETRKVPMPKPLYEIFKKIPRAIHDDHVFLFKGTPIGGDIRDSLKDACKNAGITYGRFKENGFIFHDLRHTFNTNMRKAGVPESVIMAITGHSTREMFDRYNTIDETDTRQAVDQLEVFLGNGDPSGDPNKKKPLQKWSGSL